MQNPRNIDVVVAGYSYGLPGFEVTSDGIIDTEWRFPLEFCRGDKNDESKKRQAGVFVESLLEAVVHRLKTVNVGDLASKETAMAITKVEEAILWLGKRSEDRRIRGVEGTYSK